MAMSAMVHVQTVIQELTVFMFLTGLVDSVDSMVGEWETPPEVRAMSARLTSNTSVRPPIHIQQLPLIDFYAIPTD
jgi:hypothetical protein